MSGNVVNFITQKGKDLKRIGGSKRYEYVYCTRCKLEFPSNYKYRVHMDAVHLNRKYKCGTCDKIFSAPAGLYNHNKLIHGKRRKNVRSGTAPSKVETQSSSSDDDGTICLFEPVEINKVTSIKHQSTVEHDDKHCVETNESIASQRNAAKAHDNHDKLSRSTGSEYICVICTQMFHRKNQLMEHIQTSHRFRILMMQHTGRSPWQEKWKPYLK